MDQGEQEKPTSEAGMKAGADAAGREPTGHEAAQIELLMREYDTLRQEVIQRMTGRLQLAGFMVAAGAIVASGITAEDVEPAKWITLGVVALVLGISLLLIWHTGTVIVNRLFKSIQQVEGKVNHLAEIAYGKSNCVKLEHGGKPYPNRFFPNSTSAS